MDIIDIMLAKAMTPQGKTEAYVAKANKAAQQAAKAREDAEAAAATLTSAAENLATAQELMETLSSAQINTLDTEDVDTEIKKMTVNTNVVDGTAAKTIQVITTYPDNTLNTQNVTKLYKSAGNNEDGTMTQKAIKAYIDSIPSNNGGSGISNLGSENEGKLVVIGPDGNIISSSITEETIIAALLSNGEYQATGAFGIEIDYANKSFTRTQQAEGLSMGEDFNISHIYAGRKRCVVNNSGKILAFWGDPNFSNYISGNNGQVMVYQPKFYYQRIPLEMNNNIIGKNIIKESIIISDTPQNGFKVHPIFINEDGEEVDYVLFSAYEGSVYKVASNSLATTTVTGIDFDNDYLTSVPFSKPLTGSSSLTLTRAETLASNRGAGWHIFNLEAESANQMLEIIEFGTLNGQTALGKGICDITTDGNKNQSALTGSTQTLGNASGAATSTTFEYNNGQKFNETTNGKVAISYRGIENPWGNTWNMITGVLISGDGNRGGGIPQICTNYNYSYNQITNNYQSAEFCLPNVTNGWISNLGYGNKNYDWVMMPSSCHTTANSSLPVGDSGWFTPNLSINHIVVVGGSWSFGENNGPFYYGCDKDINDTTYKSYGARLMFIPTKNSTYTENLEAWSNLFTIQ